MYPAEQLAPTRYGPSRRSAESRGCKKYIVYNICSVRHQLHLGSIAIGAFQVHVTAPLVVQAKSAQACCHLLVRGVSSISAGLVLASGVRGQCAVCMLKRLFMALGPSPVQVEPLVVKIHGCIRSKWLLQRSPDWTSHGRRSLPKYYGTSLCPLCEQTCSDLARSCCKRPRPRTIQRLRSKPRPCL